MSNFKLTPHFSFHEMTRTSHSEYLDENRREGSLVIPKLVLVSCLLEAVREVVGGPVETHSGYRCSGLNGSLQGASPRSQHAAGEAADWSPLGPDSEQTMRPIFNAVCGNFNQHQIMFGQIILESRRNSYHGRSWWIHLSLGHPFRGLEKCRQVMSIIDGRRTMLKQLSLGDWKI